MAVLRLADTDEVVTDDSRIVELLDGIGITYEKWAPAHAVAKDAPAEEILDAYSDEIEKLKASGGYVTADVIDVHPDTPNLDEMLAKFDKEHWHDEDEVRFCIEGSGVFHIHPKAGEVLAIEMHPGDLIRVPKGTHHWFDLCKERRIRAIRLFQDPSGWTPHYTNTGKDKGYMPVCMGPTFIPSKDFKADNLGLNG